MSWWDRLNDFIFWAVTSVVATMVAGAGWFIRAVLTNQKQIELMRAEFKHRDQLRAEDREDMSEIKAVVNKIQDHLIGGYDAER